MQIIPRQRNTKTVEIQISSSTLIRLRDTILPRYPRSSLDVPRQIPVRKTDQSETKNGDGPKSRLHADITDTYVWNLNSGSDEDIRRRLPSRFLPLGIEAAGIKSKTLLYGGIERGKEREGDRPRILGAHT